MGLQEYFDLIKSAIVENEILLICTSILVGLIIGAEREYQNKSAGLRTFILVSFGSCVFTILSIEIGVANPDRLAANIITGIGFLGAGVIFKDDNKIGGITTATTIWATASLGMAIGSGHLYLGLLGTLIVMVILRLLIYFQGYIDNFNKIRDYSITTSRFEDIDYCIELFKNCGLKNDLQKEISIEGSLTTVWRITGNIKNHNLLIKNLREDSKIKGYQF
jgi:putative Mg2+ transporter-C (MgtC) family protein